MNKYTRVSLLGFVMAWLPGVVHAQVTQSKFRVEVPFEFKVGDRTLPAGEYVVLQPMQHFIQLRDNRGHLVASAFTNGVESFSESENSKLRFYVSGSQYVLA